MHALDHVKGGGVKRGGESKGIQLVGALGEVEDEDAFELEAVV